MAREVCRMPESFGARLRQRRERQQIALTSIAEQTKISLSLLEALERDDVSHWPADTFVVPSSAPTRMPSASNLTSSSVSSWSSTLIRLKWSRRCRLSRQESMLHG
jgi:Helix-turn-helix domain